MRHPSITQASAATGLQQGWRSGLEESISGEIEAEGVPSLYEGFKIPYVVHKNCKYTPDFLLPNGIVIETKGRFTTQDRQKMKMIKEQHSEIDIRFVFSNANQRINKTSETRYSTWSDSNHFPWAHKNIPVGWLKEPPNWVSLYCVHRLMPSMAWPSFMPTIEQIKAGLEKEELI